MHSSKKALRDHEEHLLLYPLSTTEVLLMPRACTVDLKKNRHVDAAHFYTESHIFRHACAYASFALSRVHDSQVSQLSQCSPTTTRLPDPAAIHFAVEPLLCENKTQAQVPNTNLQWVSYGKEKCPSSPC